METNAFECSHEIQYTSHFVAQWSTNARVYQFKILSVVTHIISEWSSTEKDDINEKFASKQRRMGWAVFVCLCVWNLWKQTRIMIVMKLKVATDNQWETSMIGTFMPFKLEADIMLLCADIMLLCVISVWKHLSLIWQPREKEIKRETRRDSDGEREKKIVRLVKVQSFIKQIWMMAKFNLDWVAYRSARNIA